MDSEVRLCQVDLLAVNGGVTVRVCAGNPDAVVGPGGACVNTSERENNGGTCEDKMLVDAMLLEAIDALKLFDIDTSAADGHCYE